MDKTKIRSPQLENEAAMALYLDGDEKNSDRLLDWIERRDKYNRNCGNHHVGSRAPSLWECSIFACFFVLTVYFL